jgi:hypothetical protein
LFQSFFFNLTIFLKNFLSKLCTEIENDLRLSYHQQQSTSFENLEKLFSSQNQQHEEKSLNKLLLDLLQIPRFKLGNKIIDVFGIFFFNLKI